MEALFVLALLGVLAATLAPVLHGAWPILGLFQHFAAQLGAASGLVLIALLLCRMWRWSVLALLLTLWYGAVLYPFLMSSETDTTAAARPLKVLSINLWYLSEQHEPTVEWLLESGADVIGTVETTHEWRESLKALEPVYPYHADCIGTAFRCGVALYSKRPFREVFAGRIDGKLPTVVTASIDWQGQPLTITELQLINPLIGLDEDFQGQQAAVATGYFAKLPGDLVVMGDFNSAPWSNLQNGFRAGTGLDNRGRLAFTWPSWAPAMFRLPIDQIFVRGGIVARNVRPGPVVGSDHLPILGDIYREAR